MFVAQAVPARMVDSTFKPDLKWSTSLTDKIQKSVTDPISDSDKHLHHINKAYMLCNNQQIPTTQAEILTLFFPCLLHASVRLLQTEPRHLTECQQ